MGRKTVRRWLRAGQAPTWRHADRGTSILDPYRAYLEERWQAGCHNAAALWRDLKAQGFPGQPGIVRAWATRRRRQDPPAAPANMAGRPAASKAAEPPTPRRAVRLLTGQPDTLGDADRRFVAALLERSPAIATAVDLVSRFVTMVKDQVADALDGWLREAEASALAPFAAGLRRDEDAVRAALTEPWSNGQVEGQVNRLKVIKREMYGRAGFDLLRCRVLASARRMLVHPRVRQARLSGAGGLADRSGLSGIRRRTRQVSGGPVLADLGWEEFFRSPAPQPDRSGAGEQPRPAGRGPERPAGAGTVPYPAFRTAADGGCRRQPAAQRTPGDLSRTGRATIASQNDVSVGITSYELDLFGRVGALSNRRWKASSRPIRRGSGPRSHWSPKSPMPI